MQYFHFHWLYFCTHSSHRSVRAIRPTVMLIKISKTNKSVVVENECKWKLHIVHVLKQILLIWFYDGWRLVSWFCQLPSILMNRLIASWSPCQWISSKQSSENEGFPLRLHTVRQHKQDARLKIKWIKAILSSIQSIVQMWYKSCTRNLLWAVFTCTPVEHLFSNHHHYRRYCCQQFG